MDTVTVKQTALSLTVQRIKITRTSAVIKDKIGTLLEEGCKRIDESRMKGSKKEDSTTHLEESRYVSSRKNIDNHNSSIFGYFTISILSKIADS